MNESLLPTRTVLQGGEVLRVVGTDGRPLRVPLAALLDAAEARFATRAGEAGLLAACWQAIYAQRDDIAVLKARILVLEAKAAPATVDLAPLTARVATLENKPAPVPVDLAPLTARVTTLESEIKLKDK